MSYRHTSYRKVKKAKKAGAEIDLESMAYPRHHGNRISHWLNARPLDKPAGWGKPKATA